MSQIDLILNLAGLLLWLTWRSARLEAMTKATPATLPGTLRRAAPNRIQRWHFLAGLGALLIVRAFFYWQIGGAMNWVARLNLEITSIPFMNDFFLRMLLFSVLSFALTLAYFYLWLIFFAVVNRDKDDPIQKLARLTLGKPSRWPNWILFLLPSLIAIIAWLVLSPLLTWMGLAHSVSFVHRIGQGALLGIGSFLTWKYLIGAILGLYLLNSYIYLGKHPLWNFVNLTSRQIMRPLRKFPLEIGKVDFTPVVAIVIVFLAAGLIEDGLHFQQRDKDGITQREIMILPGLSDCYRRISM